MLLPQNFFTRHIWRRLVIYLLVVEVALISFVFLQGGKLMGDRFGHLAAILVGTVDVVFQKGDPVLNEQVAALFNRGTNIVIVPGNLLKDGDSIPNLPFIQSFIHSFELLCGDKFVVNYQAQPATFWLRKKNPPYFSVGAPYITNRFLMVIIISIFLLTVMLVIVIDWWITSRITNPLAIMAKGALLMVSDRNEHKITVPLDSLSEITVLSETLNKMHSDINRMIKDRELFISDISHDLRTPLSRIRLAVEMMDNESEQFKEDLREDLTEMASILNQTMQLAYTNQEKNYFLAKGDINQLLIEVQSKYLRVGVTVDLSLANLPAINIEEISLTRLLCNLIDNAVKYGDGEVKLISIMNGNLPTISVVNKICDSDKTNLSKDAEVISGGLVLSSNQLGLHIVERIANMHNLTVTKTCFVDKNLYEVNLSFPLSE